MDGLLKPHAAGLTPPPLQVCFDAPALPRQVQFEDVRDRIEARQHQLRTGGGNIPHRAVDGEIAIVESDVAAMRLRRRVADRRSDIATSNRLTWLKFDAKSVARTPPDGSCRRHTEARLVQR
jgi:hypothetical protein